MSKLSAFRKLAIHTWSSPNQPAIYARLDLDYTAVREYLARRNAQGITVNHVITWALGRVMHRYPNLNRRLHCGRLVQRDQVDTFLTTHLSMAYGYELSGVSIRNIADMTLTELSQTVQQAVTDLKYNANTPMRQTYRRLRWVPSLIMRPVIRVLDFVANTLRMRVPGYPVDPFGSFILTSLGSLGLSDAYIPLYPTARNACTIAVGKPKRQTNGQFTVVINATLDHRYVDGADLARPVAFLKQIMANPEAFFQVEAT
tara:strand:+ start:6311 stop:7084 length:774 start_codon:yes stop_codon:yes gene_type:complete